MFKEYPKDNRYLIYDDGRIYRKPYSMRDKNNRTLNFDGIWVTPKVSNTGYVVVSINRKWTQLHRVIAETFIPNQENKPTVNHIDGNKLNNSLSNLEWSTYKENQNHAEKNNLTGNRGGLAIDVYDDSGYVATFKSISKCANMLKLDRKIISAVKNTDNYYKGYKFITKV